MDEWDEGLNDEEDWYDDNKPLDLPSIKLPGYEWSTYLGKGSYGQVFSAIDLLNHREVAIKIL